MFRSEGIYKYRRIFPQVWQIRNCGVNVYLFTGNERSLIFDTGFGFDSLKKLAEKITDKPYDVVLSHGHYDHIGSAGEFDRVYIHPEDIPVAHLHSTRGYRQEALKKAKTESSRLFGRVLPDRFDEEEYLSRKEPEYVPLYDGQIFLLGGITLQVIHLPGHTGGSVALYWKEEKTVFTSDAANGYMFMFLPESTMLSVYRKSLMRLEEMDIRYMIQAHPNGRYKKKYLMRYMDVAEDPDWERGRERKPSLTSGPEADIRIVMSKRRPRLTARLVIEKEKID